MQAFHSLIHQARRDALKLAACALGLAFAGAAAAEDAYPQRPIRVIVPYAAGGLPDSVIRRVAPRLEKELGQTIVVDNKPGANGIVAAQALLAAPNDGYTVIFSDSAFLSITPLTMKTPPYSTRDFVPVSLAARAPNFLAVHPSVPANTLPEFLAHVRSNAGKLTCGSSGMGTLHHLTLEAMKRTLELEVAHVPYRGSGQSVPAMVGGQTQCTLAALPSLVGHAAAGTARVLAVASNRRSPLAPDALPMFEGRDGYDFAFLLGIVARQGTPANVVGRLAAAMAATMRDPESVASLRKMGVEAIGGTSAEYAAALRGDSEQLSNAAKVAGMRPE